MQTQQTTPAPPKKKLTRLAIFLLIYIPAAIIANYIIANSILSYPSTLLKILLLLTIISIPLFAIAVIIRVTLHPDNLMGRFIAVPVLIISLIIIYYASYYSVPRAGLSMARLYCGTHFSQLGKAICLYANDHDGTLPAENWCDIFIEKYDITPNDFRCDAARTPKGLSAYTLNKHVAGKKLSNPPDDLVILFETEPGWNQIADPLSAKVACYHGDDRCEILFADMHFESVSSDVLPNLKWTPDQPLPFTIDTFAPLPQQQQTDYDTFQKTSLAIIAAIAIVFTLAILIKTKPQKYWPLFLIITPLSTLAGWYFANKADYAYYSPALHDLAATPGIFFGLLAGLAFPAIITTLPQKIKNLQTFLGFTTTLGIITGITASTLVHITLMIQYLETNPFGITIGLPHATFAGTILGAITAALYKAFYKNKIAVKETTNG